MRSMRVTGCAGLVLLALASAGALRAEGPPVVHAEVPSCPLAFRAGVLGWAILRVTIDKDGKVTSDTVERSLPIAVRCAEDAAKKWTFVPSDRYDIREAELSFVFAEEQETEETSHVVSSFDDPWTVRLAYARSTILRLSRVNGEIPEKRCPLHDEVMGVELVLIRGGLPSGSPMDKGFEGKSKEAEWEAYRDAREKLFPETNWHAAVGCIVPTETKEEVYYCQACRDAERAWLKSHPGFDPDRF